MVCHPVEAPTVRADTDRHSIAASTKTAVPAVPRPRTRYASRVIAPSSLPARNTNPPFCLRQETGIFVDLVRLAFFGGKRVIIYDW